MVKSPSKLFLLPRRNYCTANVQAARQHCSQLIRKHDHPSHVLQAFIPPAARDAHLSLRAFNISLAQIPDSVSDPSIGALRLRFWRDAIDNMFAGQMPKEPVATLLAHGLQIQKEGSIRHTQKHWLLKIISAREKYLSNAPYATLDALEQYAEDTYSTLLYLTLSSLSLNSLSLDHLASHVGKAEGIAAVLRGLPLLAFPQQQSPQMPQGTVVLPLDVMANVGVREEDVFRQGGGAPRLRDAVFTVATRASDHLITARVMMERIRAGQDAGHVYEHAGEDGHVYGPSDDDFKIEAGFGVLMRALATRIWLQSLESVDFDIFHPSLLSTRDWRLPWKTYWAFRRGRFW